MRSTGPWKTTVSAAAESFDLTVLQTVKDELGLTDGARDNWISRQINQASRIIATFCNREFAEETLIDTFRLQECDWAVDTAILSRIPVSSIASIVEAGATLTAGQYEFDPATGFVHRLENDERTSWAAAKVTVMFTAGYELLTELPHDIERACVDLVKQAYFAKGRDPLVKGEEVPGVLRTDYWVGAVGEDGALPPDVADRLNPYRMVTV